MFCFEYCCNSALQINTSEFTQGFFRAEGRTVFQTARTGVACFIDLLEDELIVIFAELQIDSAGMTRGVQMCDAVEVVDDVGDDVTFHDLLMIDIIDDFSKIVEDIIAKIEQDKHKPSSRKDRYSKKDDKQIIELFAKGLTRKEIAEVMNRTESGIARRLGRLNYGRTK